MSSNHFGRKRKDVSYKELSKEDIEADSDHSSGDEKPSKKATDTRAINVATPTSTNVYTGRAVTKEFPPHGKFSGTVTFYDEDEELWKVTYLDGDEEEFTTEELKPLLDPPPAAAAATPAPSAGKRKAGTAANVPESPTPEASSSSTPNDEQDERATKRSRELASSLCEEYICAITHELMVDPVVADDGNTYERSAIMQWLQTNTKSPLDPSTTIDPSRLVGSRAVFKSIEKLVMLGDIDKNLRSDWLARKKAFDLVKAQILYDEGRVYEAANLGLPQAQGRMAENYFFGTNNFEKDFDKCFEFSTKAAEAGHKMGKFRLGCLYHHGIGTAKDWRAALKWYGRAAEQQCHVSANNIGHIYSTGGNGVQKDTDTAFTWTEKAAVGGHMLAQASLGFMFYSGIGVAKDFAAARKWYKQSADQGGARGQCFLGKMMIQGEGGSKNLGAGTILLEKAAAQGNDEAKELLSSIEACAKGWS